MKTGNEKNLIKIDSTERARELGSKGGKANGRKCKERKLIKEQLNILMSMPLKDNNAKEQLKALGIDEKNLDNQMLIVIALWQRAIKGDVTAFTTIRDTLGEKPIDKVENKNIAVEEPLLLKALEAQNDV